MKISLNLSGAPSVLKDGKRVVFPTKKAEAIFYYVALVGQVSKSALELIFWPELDQLGANKNLRNSIYYITKIFGRDVFKKDRGVLEFSDGVELELLTEPLGGEFMEGFYLKDCPDFNSFAEEYNKRQSMRLYNSAKGVFLDELAKGKLTGQQALGRIAVLSKMDPYDEEVVLAVMERCFTEKRLDDLILLYRDFEKRLISDLMVEPRKELQNLYRTALMQKKAARGNTEPYFYGRREELKKIDGAHRNFSAGEPYANLIIAGGIGSGKTCLLNHYLRNNDVAGTTVISLVCYEAEAKIEYRILSLLTGKMLKALKIGTAALPESYRRIMLYFFPFMFHGGAQGEAPRIDKASLPLFELEDLFSELFGYLAARGKFVVVIDDIRFCDRRSLDFIQRVAVYKYCRRGRLMLSWDESWLGEYIKTFDKSVLQNIDIIELRNFERGEVESIAARSLKEPGAELVDSIYRESGGNPLYLFEIINNLKENKNVKSYKFFYLLENRLKTLSDHEQAVLYISSTFFSGIMPEAVASIVGVDYIKALELYEPLVRNGFLKEEIKDGRLTLLFAHEQFRSYIYQSQPLIKRKTIHMKIAEYLAAYGEKNGCLKDHIDNIIYHYGNAGQTTKYLHYKLMKAASIVSIDNDFPEFLTSFTQSFIDELEDDFSRQPVPVDLQYEFTLLKASFAIKTCDYGRGLEYIERLLEFDTDTRRLLKARKQLIYYGIQTRDYTMIKENAVEALRILKKIPDDVERADILKSYALAEINCRRYKNAKSMLLKSLSLLCSAPLNENVISIRACVFNYLAYEYKYAGEYERCIPLYRKAIELCLSANITNGLPLFYMNLGQALVKTGRLKEAKEYFLKFEILREQIYSALSTTIVKAYLAFIYSFEKNYRLSAKYLAEGFECSRLIKNPYEYAYLYKICALLKKNAAADGEAAADIDSVLPESYEYYRERAAENFITIGLERELAEFELPPTG